MILIIDNTRRRLREELRHEYLKRMIPCVLSDLDHCAEYMPCSAVQVTEKYLLKDAAFVADMHGVTDVYCSENVLEFAVPHREHMLLSSNGVVYCSKSIYLTKTERLIVRLLLFAVKGSVMPETVRAYCMSGSAKLSSVCAHISNINKKAVSATGIPLIDCRRFEGYRLHEFK